jgi:hypothetical protein
MKTTALLRRAALVLGMAIPCQLSAQNDLLISTLQHPRMRHDAPKTFETRFLLTNGALAPFPRPAAASRKTTVQNARLVGYYLMQHNGTAYQGSDSFRIFWSGTRGANFNYAQTYLYLNYLLGEMPPQSEQLLALELLKGVNYDSTHTYKWNNGTNHFDSLKSRVLTQLNGDLLQGLTSLIHDGNTGLWENEQKAAVTHNSSNNLTSITNQNWDGATWENSSRTTVNYDGAQHPTEFAYSSWNSGGSTWENDNRNVYAYTGDDLTSDTYQDWDGVGNTWENNDRRIFTYDAGRWATTVTQDWDGLGSTWDNETRRAYTYDTAGRITQELIQEWPFLGSNWENYSRVIYAYDASGNVTSVTQQDWDGSAWENDTRVTYTYSTSGSGSTTQAIMQEWNAGSWENETRLTVHFNEFDKATDIIYQSWDMGGFWDLKNGDQKYAFMFETFDDGTSRVDNLARQTGFKYYPNPATTSLTVEAETGALESVWMLDLNGRPVFRHTPSAGNALVTIPTAHLSPGVYFLRVQHGGKTESTSVLVQ